MKKRFWFFQFQFQFHFSFFLIFAYGCNHENQDNPCLHKEDCDSTFFKPIPNFQIAQFADRLDNGMSGNYTQKILARDVNEDGYPDILILPSPQVSVQKEILLFLWDQEKKSYYQTNSISFSISGIACFLEVEDFNQDGHLDVAILSFASVELQILVGDGTGKFSYQKSIPIGPIENPWIFTLGKFNKSSDKSLDFFILGLNGDSKNLKTFISIVSQDGKGNYDTPKVKQIGESPPFQAIVGDINEDGISDILASFSLDKKEVSFLQGNEAKILLDPKTISLPEVPDTMALGHWQKSGHLDLALFHNHTFYVLPGDGMGTFGSPLISMDLQKDVYAYSLRLIDINQDGNLDAVFPNTIYQNVCILYGNGSSGIKSQEFISTGADVWWMDVADLNGDHHLDMVAGTTSATYSVLYQKPTKDGFEKAKNFGLAPSVLQGLASGKFRGKAGKELAILDGGGEQIIAWPVGSEDKLVPPEVLYAAFSAFVHQTSVEQGIISVGNLNPKKDSLDDIIVAEKTPGKEKIQVHMSSFSITGNYHLDKKEVYPLSSKPISVFISDVTSDQNTDVVVLINSGFLLLQGNGDGTLQSTPQEVKIAEMKNPSGLAVGDIDSDGILDIAVSNSGNQNILLFLSGNQGRNAYNPLGRLQVQPVLYPSQEIKMVDLNQDQALDLVVTYPKQKQVGLLLHQKDGSFLSQAVEVAAEPGALEVGDINGDKRVDLIVSHPNQNLLTLLFGKGDGSLFETKQTLEVGEGPNALMIEDFDKNGLLDIAAMNQKSKTISLLYNQTPSTF